MARGLLYIIADNQLRGNAPERTDTMKNNWSIIYGKGRQPTFKKQALRIYSEAKEAGIGEGRAMGMARAWRWKYFRVMSWQDYASQAIRREKGQRPGKDRET